MKTSVGTAAACGIPIAFFGSLSFVVLGLNQENLPSLTMGYIYIPAMIVISLASVFTASIGAWAWLLFLRRGILGECCRCQSDDGGDDERCERVCFHGGMLGSVDNHVHIIA